MRACKYLFQSTEQIQTEHEVGTNNTCISIHLSIDDRQLHLQRFTNLIIPANSSSRSNILFF